MLCNLMSPRPSVPVIYRLKSKNIEHYDDMDIISFFYLCVVFSASEKNEHINKSKMHYVIRLISISLIDEINFLMPFIMFYILKIYINISLLLFIA